MRAQTDGLQWTADGARLDRLAGAHRGPILETLAVADRVDSTSLPLNRARLRQLVERGEAGFIDEVVLAMAHRGNTQTGTLVGNPPTGDQLDA